MILSMSDATVVPGIDFVLDSAGRKQVVRDEPASPEV